MKYTLKNKRAFQTFILHWWQKNKRDLPWRHTHNPYNILISEIMLQQTQVSRVLTKYHEFIQRFPDVYTLSRATRSDILRIWKGMGYNRRAIFLYQIAQTVVKDFNGNFPKNEKSLLKLPGIGTYTARAILIFAFRKHVAAVDTNIHKVITHFFFNGTKQKMSTIQHIADKLVPEDLSWEWHHALMDYAALSLAHIKNNNNSQTTPFRETTRYYRGRVIDLLREKDFSERKLLYLLCKKFGKSENFFKGILNKLEVDKLIVRKNTHISLPL